MSWYDIFTSWAHLIIQSVKTSAASNLVVMGWEKLVSLRSRLFWLHSLKRAFCFVRLTTFSDRLGAMGYVMLLTISSALLTEKGYKMGMSKTSIFEELTLLAPFILFISQNFWQVGVGNGVKGYYVTLLTISRALVAEKGNKMGNLTLLTIHSALVVEISNT